MNEIRITKASKLSLSDRDGHYRWVDDYSGKTLRSYAHNFCVTYGLSQCDIETKNGGSYRYDIETNELYAHDAPRSEWCN